MKPFLTACIFLILTSQYCLSQNLDTIAVKAVIEDGDTIPVIDLTEMTMVAPYLTSTPDDAKKLAKLVRMVKKVYPYAKLAGMRFRQMNDQITAAPDRKARKKIIQLVEDEINSKYGNELKNLTFSQGKILIKLIDRETGNSSFDVVREFKGSFMAFFYQSFARIWGFNLKTKYDPNGEDKDIELIIQLIEKGQI